MNTRLVRALKKGGVATALSDGLWGVWRRPDRRSQKIGNLSDGDVTLLRLYGYLSPLGAGGEESRLVWTGPAGDIDYAEPSTDALSGKHTSQTRRPLVDHVLIGVSEASERKRLARAVLEFQYDLERASWQSTIPGMNWRALQGGTRLDSQVRRDRIEANLSSQEARQRLDQLQAYVSEERMMMVSALIIERVSKTRFAQKFDIKVEAVIECGQGLLQQLAEGYDSCVTPVSAD